MNRFNYRLIHLLVAVGAIGALLASLRFPSVATSLVAIVVALFAVAYAFFASLMRGSIPRIFAASFGAVVVLGTVVALLVQNPMSGVSLWQSILWEIQSGRSWLEFHGACYLFNLYLMLTLIAAIAFACIVVQLRKLRGE